MREPHPFKSAFESQVGSENRSICPEQSQTWKVMNDEHDISSKLVLVVGSRKSVSEGSILWKTTFFIDVLPLLLFAIGQLVPIGEQYNNLVIIAYFLSPMMRIRGLDKDDSSLDSSSSSSLKLSSQPQLAGIEPTEKSTTVFRAVLLFVADDAFMFIAFVPF